MLEKEWRKSTFEEELERHGSIVYTNVGTSMMPLLRQGRDLMVIKKRTEERCRKYDAVLFKRTNGQYILHRILKVREQDDLIAGDNCWQKEYVKEEQILGILTEIVRDGRKIKVTDKGYLFYVHLWCDFFLIRVFLLKSRETYWAFRGKIVNLLRKMKIK